MGINFKQQMAGIFRAWCFPVLDALAYLFSLSPSIKEAKETILIVHTLNIGDYILWADSAAALRRLYPKDSHRIVFLGSNQLISLAESSGFFDEAWGVDTRKFETDLGYRLSFLVKLRQRRFSAVIYPLYSRNLLVGDSIVRGAVASLKIGSTGDCANIKAWKKRLSDHWYTKLVPASDNPMMELVRNAEFMRGLGVEDFKANLPVLPVTTLLPEPLCGKSYFILFPGGSMDFKRWPVENFSEIGRRIHEKTGWTAVVCGGPDDMALADAFMSGSRMPVENWVGRTSLPELATIIAHAKLLVGNDTGAVHMAAAVSVPAVYICGGGQFGRFFPYKLEVDTKRPVPVAVYHTPECVNCNWRCLYPSATGEPFPCVHDISVTEVWQAVDKVLGRYQVMASRNGHLMSE